MAPKPAYDDERVKPHARAAAAEIRDKFGITNIGGFATSGHIPGSDHYTGLAIDVMTAQGTPIADYAIANAARWGVTYIIWNRRIWDTRKAGGWLPYTGASPHTDHVHISFRSEGGTGGNPVDSISGSNNPELSTRAGCLKFLTDWLGV